MIETQVAVADRFNDTLIIFDWQELTERHSLHFKIFWVKQVYPPPPNCWNNDESLLYQYPVILLLFRFSLWTLGSPSYTSLAASTSPKNACKNKLFWKNSSLWCHEVKPLPGQWQHPQPGFHSIFGECLVIIIPPLTPAIHLQGATKQEGKIPVFCFFLLKTVNRGLNTLLYGDLELRGKNLRMGIIWGKKAL